MDGLTIQNFTDTDSAAFKAGLLEGDVLLTCGGSKLQSVDQLIELMGSLSGDVIVTLMRGTAVIEKTLPAGKLGAALSPVSIADIAKPGVTPSMVRTGAVSVPGPLSGLLYILALLSFGGGVFLAGQFWPQSVGYGAKIPTAMYVLPAGWLVAGFFQAVILVAIGQALSYLHRIAVNTAK